MLVLSRRVGESIMIGDDVVVTVLEVRGDVVRIGVAAPREIAVHREEVYRELAEANQQAASPSDAVVDALARAVRSGGPPVPGQGTSTSDSRPSP
ncbi:MAG: carbon storage regulator CsrA [Actinomycetes bacterium]